MDALDTELLAAHSEAGAPPFLHFTPEAQALFDDWRSALEDRPAPPMTTPSSSRTSRSIAP